MGLVIPTSDPEINVINSSLINPSRPGQDRICPIIQTSKDIINEKTVHTCSVPNKFLMPRKEAMANKEG